MHPSNSLAAIVLLAGALPMTSADAQDTDPLSVARRDLQLARSYK